jgi:flagellar hook assembly protein FlgD
MLAPVRPNPARGLAAMRYAIPSEANVSLAIFDPSGRRVRSLFQGRAPAGDHVEYWDGLDDSRAGVASGQYYLRMEFTGRVLTRSFAIVK